MANNLRQSQSQPAAYINEWVRPPRPPERIEGQSRSGLYDLSSRGLIKTKTIRRPGSKKGIRLFSVPSIRAYIASLPDEGEVAA